jgi:hypothetical protein
MEALVMPNIMFYHPNLHTVRPQLLTWPYAAVAEIGSVPAQQKAQVSSGLLTFVHPLGRSAIYNSPDIVKI